MAFTPSHSFLKHHLGSEAKINAWMTAMQGPAHVEPRLTTPVFGVLDPIADPRSSHPLENGPITPTGTCPQTGRELRLYCLHDLTCAILRKGPEGGPDWEILPAAFSVPSEIHDASLKELNAINRTILVPKLKLQARKEGIFWSYRRAGKPLAGETSDADILGYFAEEIEKMAALVLSERPIADPRCHKSAPEGTRFAPFCDWPEISDHEEDIRHMERAVQALARLHMQKFNMQRIGVRVQRRAPDTPWKSANRTPQVIVRPDRGGLERAIRALLDAPNLKLSDNLKYGPDREVLLDKFDFDAPISNHEKLAESAALFEALAGRDVASLYARNTPSEVDG